MSPCPTEDTPLCGPGRHEGPSMTFRRGWQERAQFLVYPFASQGGSNSPRPLYFSVPNHLQPLPSHFPLAQVTVLRTPIGCLLLLAPAFKGTGVSKVALETGHAGHKIQKLLCSGSPPPSKGMIAQPRGSSLPQPTPTPTPYPTCPES